MWAPLSVSVAGIQTPADDPSNILALYFATRTNCYLSVCFPSHPSTSSSPIKRIWWTHSRVVPTTKRSGSFHREPYPHKANKHFLLFQCTFCLSLYIYSSTLSATNLDPIIFGRKTWRNRGGCMSGLSSRGESRPIRTPISPSRPDLSAPNPEL